METYKAESSSHSITQSVSSEVKLISMMTCDKEGRVGGTDLGVSSIL